MKILSISCDRKHLSISKFVILILDIHENHLLPAFKPNLTFITGVIAPKSPQNGPHLIQNVKRSILSVKPTTRNTHKLKLRDPKAMGGWPYYRLFENLCCPFGTVPEWNLSPIFQIKLKRTRNLQGLASFWIMSVFKKLFSQKIQQKKSEYPHMFGFITVGTFFLLVGVTSIKQTQS